MAFCLQILSSGSMAASSPTSVLTSLENHAQAAPSAFPPLIGPNCNTWPSWTNHWQGTLGLDQSGFTSLAPTRPVLPEQPGCLPRAAKRACAGRGSQLAQWERSLCGLSRASRTGVRPWEARRAGGVGARSVVGPGERAWLAVAGVGRGADR